MPFIALALIVAAALGGGTSLAAQAALPGDALWGFKVGVNEALSGTMAIGEKAKADWDIARAEARLDEAAKLSAAGKLDAEAQADVQANFDQHAQAVAEHIAKLQADNNFSAAADVAARFQASVANRASVLADARAHANVNAQDALNAVLSRVQATLTTASNLSAEASAKAAAHQEASTTTSGGNQDANGTVQTGTSVQGGQGGIKVNTDTDVEVGI